MVNQRKSKAKADLGERCLFFLCHFEYQPGRKGPERVCASETVGQGPPERGLESSGRAGEW